MRQLPPGPTPTRSSASPSRRPRRTAVQVGAPHRQPGTACANAWGAGRSAVQGPPARKPHASGCRCASTRSPCRSCSQSRGPAPGARSCEVRVNPAQQQRVRGAPNQPLRTPRPAAPAGPHVRRRPTNTSLPPATYHGDTGGGLGIRGRQRNRNADGPGHRVRVLACVDGAGREALVREVVGSRHGRRIGCRREPCGE